MLNTSETLSEKFIKKWFWLYFFSILIAPIGYIVKIILSYDLTVEEIWVLYWIISLIVLLSIYHDLWLTESLNYFLPKFIVNKDYSRFKSVLFYTFLAQVPTSIFLWLILYISSWYLANNYFKAQNLVLETQMTIQIFCLFFVWINLFQFTSTIFWAAQNTKIQKLVDFLRMFAVLWFTFWFWFFDKWNLINYAWTWIIWVWIWIFFSYIFFYKIYYKPYLKEVKIIYDKILIKKLFSYAFWVLIAINISTILSQIDMQLVIYILWIKDAWYYSNYLSIIWIPFLFVWPIIWFLFPVISSLHSENGKEKITIIKSIFYKYFSVISIYISIFMFIFWPHISTILFWQKFMFSWIILQYSILFLIFNMLLHINFQILSWQWSIKDRVKILWIWLTINLILNIFLINLFKPYWFWAAWSSLAVWLSWIPIFVLSHFATKEYVINFDFKFFIKNFIIILIINLFLYFYIEPYFFGLNRIYSLLFLILIWLLYTIIIAMFNLKELKLFILEIKKIKNNK
jgi:O-antigen/teichoic acid export membrane protein